MIGVVFFIHTQRAWAKRGLSKARDLRRSKLHFAFLFDVNRIKSYHRVVACTTATSAADDDDNTDIDETVKTQEFKELCFIEVFLNSRFIVSSLVLDRRRRKSRLCQALSSSYRLRHHRLQNNSSNNRFTKMFHCLFR